MSSKIYFTNNQSRGLLWWVIHLITSSMLLLSTAKRVKLANKLLLKPVRRNIIHIPASMHLERLTTDYGEVQLYSVGQGPVVLLSHGWSGSASQLFGLMDKIAAMGYQAVAFDQFAHGRSSGDIANLFLFIKAQQSVLAHVHKNNSVAAIVTHSMAGTAAMNLCDNHTPMLLIAPVFDFAHSLFSKVEESGVNKQLLVDVLSALEKQHHIKVSDIDPRQHIVKSTNPIHIVHDRGDQFAPYKDSEMQQGLVQHITLTATEGLGHGRIINSNETLSAFQQMMDEVAPKQKMCG